MIANKAPVTESHFPSVFISFHSCIYQVPASFSNPFPSFFSVLAHTQIPDTGFQILFPTKSKQKSLKGVRLQKMDRMIFHGSHLPVFHACL